MPWRANEDYMAEFARAAKQDPPQKDMSEWPIVLIYSALGIAVLAVIANADRLLGIISPPRF